MPTIDTFFNEAKQALALAPDLQYQRVITASDATAILTGRQTARSSSFALYMQAHAPLPEAHDISVVASRDQTPLALLYTEDVAIRPFAALDADHARREGAADLASWRKAKRTALAAAHQAAGLTFDPATAMLVVEHFRVLYPFSA